MMPSVTNHYVKKNERCNHHNPDHNNWASLLWEAQLVKA